MAYKFSEKTEERFQWLLSRYPQKEAVLLPLLHLVQNEAGFLTPEALDYVAERMATSPARIKEVASFYSLFRLNKKGQYVLQVCHNISCYLRGSDELIEKIKAVLGIKEGDCTPDGKFSLERVECLASCGSAPVMQVNGWDFHENLDLEKLEKILEALKQDKWADPSFTKRTQEGSLA